MSDELPFKEGDLVMVKSGGPTMTVEQIDERLDEPLICVWMHAGNQHRGKFGPAALKKVDQKPVIGLTAERG